MTSQFKPRLNVEVGRLPPQKLKPASAAAAPMGMDDRADIVRALQLAGLDAWTPSRHQDCPNLITVELSVAPGRVWLRPHFTPQFEQLEMAIAVACEAIHMFAWSRLHEVPGAPEYATEDEALALWERLRQAAEARP